MPNHHNNYGNMGLTGKSRRKQEKPIATALMVPFAEDEAHEHGENIEVRENRINDQTKSGKRRGAMLLTDKHGLVVASGSRFNDIWYSFNFEEVGTIQPV
ncbi:hypothetical protein CUZ12_23640 [Salmonella enterica subsp. enterica serovar Heidelberg]|nr:hypothetical protein [Salmonella enterica subsp. enterica serovar Heidelberg]